MSRTATKSRFEATLHCPTSPNAGEPWAFVVLPQAVSDLLPRRGRTSIEGTINGVPFQATLEPDGRRSHWLKVEQALCEASGAAAGDTVTLEVAPLAVEPEPKVPPDLQAALAASPEARAAWEATTTIARVDWIHWIESAKQAKTRDSRVESARDMLASGKKRVCCFDPSGVYSKSLCSPEAVE